MCVFSSLSSLLENKPSTSHLDQQTPLTQSEPSSIAARTFVSIAYSLPFTQNVLGASLCQHNVPGPLKHQVPGVWLSDRAIRVPSPLGGAFLRITSEI
jgi:hypothetical protein